MGSDKFPEGSQPIGVKWVFKKKMNTQGEIERYKAQLIAKGYKQKAGIDYDEVFAPIGRMETIRLLIFQVLFFDNRPGKSFLFGERKSSTGGCWKKNKMRKITKRENG